ncbi:Beta-glucosidase 30 [Phytophthora nicotianae]|uniref:Beta-glucosidase 30 n=1 Tax=Phytophthora nicotianae TaxID=4792 RepID=A0A0W8D6J6_PHYNI|nr:Beta-glucosidase 30 [Phytophthora nicotianae]
MAHDDEFGLKRSSGVDYSQVLDRQIDDNRFERQRAIRAASSAPPAEQPKHAGAKAAAPQSATMDAFMRMMTGKEERTIADRISDPNRPTWEQYKKENADKLDLSGNGEKEMKEYRKKLDAAREKKLAGSSSSKKRKKKHKKRTYSSSSEDSSSEDERRRSKHKSRKKNHLRIYAMADAESRRKFMELLRQGVQYKVQQQQQIKVVSSSDLAGKAEALQAETSDEVRRASLPRSGKDVAGMAAWQTLAWRDAFSMAPYFLETVNDRPLRIKQVLQGELNGFGTGLTVWPAACVLLKHLEYRAANNPRALLGSNNPFVLELGSGTGAVGIAAAMLLRAGRVVLSDMDNIRFIMQENADVARLDGAINNHVKVDVEAYEWGQPPSASLVSQSYPDLILVSDCILPRLYPIEPLVEALTLLSRPHTRILISYEHRHYQHFQPKQRFWELMEARTFSLREIDSTEYHPHFVASDIEVWEITPPTQGQL